MDEHMQELLILKMICAVRKESRNEYAFLFLFWQS